MDCIRGSSHRNFTPKSTLLVRANGNLLRANYAICFISHVLEIVPANLLYILLLVTTWGSDYTFRTQCAVYVDAPAPAADIVIEQLIYDFQYDFEHLFDWAFHNLGRQGNTDNDALLLESKSIIYNPEEEFGSITLDVFIGNSIKLRNVTIQGTIKDLQGDSAYAGNLDVDNLHMENIPTWYRQINIRANPSSFVFQQAFGSLYVIPCDEGHSIYFMDINFRFEWYLRLFVTKKVYQNTIQWRIERYMNNLKNAAEHPDLIKTNFHTSFL